MARPNRHHTDVLQGVQGPPFGPWNPGLQIQLSRSLDPLKLDEFAGQGRQFARVCIPTPVEYVPDGQSRQVELTLAATVVEYLPDSQAMQVSAVVAVYVPEYVPAEHAVQTCASSSE